MFTVKFHKLNFEKLKKCVQQQSEKIFYILELTAYIYHHQKFKAVSYSKFYLSDVPENPSLISRVVILPLLEFCLLFLQHKKINIDEGFSNLGTVGIWVQVILYCGVCPVHCRQFSCIPGLCPLDASSNSPPSMTTKNVA